MTTQEVRKAVAEARDKGATIEFVYNRYDCKDVRVGEPVEFVDVEQELLVVRTPKGFRRFYIENMDVVSA